MEFFLEFVKTNITDSMVIGILAVLSQALLTYWLARRMETNKTENSKTLESFKTELQQVTQKMNVQFSALHTKRVEVITKMYEYFTDVGDVSAAFIDAVNDRMSKDTPDFSMEKPQNASSYPFLDYLENLTDDERLKLKLMHGACEEIIKYYRTNRIWFSVDTAQSLSMFCQNIRTLATTYNILSDNKVSAANKDKVGTLIKETLSKLNDVEGVIENEFRALVGVV